MRLDIAKKRGAFIGKTNSLLQEFSNTSSEVFLKLLNCFTTNLYGSNLWNLFGKDCERLYTSYNVAIRNILNIDRRTHRYLIEPLSNSLHMKTMLASRFVTFHHSLRNSPKFPVRFLAKLCESDLRTVHGKNLDEISRLCDQPVSSLTSRIVKEKLQYRVVPEDQKWRLEVYSELSSVGDNRDLILPGFTDDERNQILHFICVS